MESYQEPHNEVESNIPAKCIIRLNWEPYNADLETLTDFWPMIPFYTSWKVYLCFQRGGGGGGGGERGVIMNYCAEIILFIM